MMKDALLVTLSRVHVLDGTGVDLTYDGARGSAAVFAPDNKIAWAHRAGTMTDEEYLAAYEQQLSGISKQMWRKLYDGGLKNGGNMPLACRCLDREFCHVLVLIRYACRVWPKAFRCED